MFVLLALLFLLAPLRAQTLLIRRATVIDMVSPKPRKNTDVLVEGNHILAVGPKIKAPRGAQILEAKGKFLIPGLWDMHVHLGIPDAFFPMLVANGITGIREMFTGIPLPLIQQWRNRPDVPLIAASGFLDGPAMLAAPSIPPGAFAISTADQGRYAVHVINQAGYDFIKVYDSLPRDAYFAIAQEARAINFPFAGHVPEAVSPLEASNAGQRSQEHLINILLACSANEDALHAERLRISGDASLSSDARLRILSFPDPKGLFDTYSPEKAANLFAAFVRNGTWQTPTLALFHGFAYGEELSSDPGFRYMPESWRKAAPPREKTYLKDLSSAEFDALTERIRALLARYKQLVGDMHRAGVKILAGTDTSLTNPVIPGVSLHQELALLVESGLTPYEALETATRNPAQYFSAPQLFGTIEAGKFADLILLDANPLADIHNTRKIRAVVMRGRYFSRPDLDAMLARASGAPSDSPAPR